MVDEFISGWLRMTFEEREQYGVTADDMLASEWVTGVADDQWILPGSQTETNLRAKGVPLLNP
jgi:hypothetical protein